MKRRTMNRIAGAGAAVDHRRRNRSERGRTDVTHYADDRPCNPDLVGAKSNAAAQRVLARKDSPDERIVHHHRFRWNEAMICRHRRPDEMMRIENATPLERDFQGGKEFGANLGVVDDRPLGEGQRRTPHYANAAFLEKTIVAQWNVGT